ncbi:MAG: hypothetical protein FWD15_04680 [Alphaproteobacteria bacterium]|nr:hypothetical protein [Alphaproteobacteria bacterium]
MRCKFDDYKECNAGPEQKCREIVQAGTKSSLVSNVRKVVANNIEGSGEKYVAVGKAKQTGSSQWYQWIYCLKNPGAYDR